MKNYRWRGGTTVVTSRVQNILQDIQRIGRSYFDLSSDSVKRRNHSGGNCMQPNIAHLAFTGARAGKQ
jgi:hypothetical protein